MLYDMAMDVLKKKSKEVTSICTTVVMMAYVVTCWQRGSGWTFQRTCDRRSKFFAVNA
jgi:hypothetical protein